MSFGRRKPKVHHFYHPFWPFQIPKSSLWPIIDSRTSFEGLVGFRHVVDDVVTYDRDIESHMQHVKQFLQWCQE